VSELRGQHLHLDCASGIAGDMTLAALIDLGVPVEAIGAALDAIGAGRERLHVHRVVKAGVAAVDVKVDVSGETGLAHVHGHGHGQDEPVRKIRLKANVHGGARMHRHAGIDDVDDDDHDHDHDHDDEVVTPSAPPAPEEIKAAFARIAQRLGE
jgi:uncharacterized protein (DUF111 family)